jgi:SAM-dependent methyltransferase
MGLVAAARRRLVPSVRNSTWAYRELLSTHVARSSRWLDLGCGHQLLPTWMHDGERAAAALVERCAIVVGVDRDPSLGRHTTIRHKISSDIEQLPFRDRAFDLVSANMVLEHVSSPPRLLREVHRVLAPGGAFVFHTPNRRFYQIAVTEWIPQRWRRSAASVVEGRAIDDVFPTHYRVNTRDDIATHARDAGLSVDSVAFVNSGLTFGKFPPLALVEVGIVWLLETRMCEGGRSNLLAALRKPGAA